MRHIATRGSTVRLHVIWLRDVFGFLVLVLVAVIVLHRTGAQVSQLHVQQRGAHLHGVEMATAIMCVTWHLVALMVVTVTTGTEVCL